MNNIYTMVSFKLKEVSLLDDWRVLSAKINEEMSSADGLIFRDSAVGEDGLVYCILKWENEEKQQAFRKFLDKDMADNPDKYSDFGRLVDMSTMKNEIISVI